MKTLAVILHHNTFQYTDQLYEMLAPYAGPDYDLVVVDNGSEKGKESKYATFTLDFNCYFGGAMNIMFNHVIENPEYDSLLFLNSDLIVHGQKFVTGLRCASTNYDVVSPCIIQPEKTQNHWKQMHCWSSNDVRDVKWIDLQAPYIKRHVIEKIKEFDELLIYGLGIDVLLGIICEQNKWRTCVADNVPAVHLGSATLKQMKIVNEYCQKAEQGQWEYFKRENLTQKVMEFRKWAEEYQGHL